jgi:hypothetical protein
MAIDRITAPECPVAAPTPQLIDDIEDPLKRAKYNTFVGENYSAEDCDLGGYGSFDLSYTPTDDRVDVRLRLAFAFLDGVPKAGEAAADYTWDEAADKEVQTTFRKDFMEKIEAAWSCQFEMAVEAPTDAGLKQSPKWSELTPDVAIDLQDSDNDPHFTVEVAKLPAGGYTRSTVTRPVRGKDGKPTGPGTVNVDTEDLTGIHKKGGSAGTKQRTALHEFGHMLGLEDEYFSCGRREEGDETRQGSKVSKEYDDNDAVMASGEEIEETHYASITAALNSAVSEKGVVFKTK